MSPPVLLLAFFSAAWRGACVGGVEGFAVCCLACVAFVVLVLQAVDLQGYGGAARCVGIACL